MIYNFSTKIQTFKYLDIEDVCKCLRFFAEALTYTNLLFLKNLATDLPSLYSIKPKYVDKIKEEWQDIPTVLANKSGDCKDLCCWRLAEIRRNGGDGEIVFDYKKISEDRFIFHSSLIVDGRNEDPSKILL
jgi:hypothetical protein